MSDPFSDRVPSIKADSQKHIFFSRSDLSYIASKLQPQRSNARSLGGGARRGGVTAGRRSAGAAAEEAHSSPLSDTYIQQKFLLVGDGDRARVCRLLVRQGKERVYPVVALEDLEGVFQEHHEALGHCGAETLYGHVGGQGLLGYVEASEESRRGPPTLLFSGHILINWRAPLPPPRPAACQPGAHGGGCHNTGIPCDPSRPCWLPPPGRQGVHGQLRHMRRQEG